MLYHLVTQLISKLDKICATFELCGKEFFVDIVCFHSAMLNEVYMYEHFRSYFWRSVPLPKDVDHFKRERKLAISKSLQVCFIHWMLRMGESPCISPTRRLATPLIWKHLLYIYFIPSVPAALQNQKSTLSD